MDEHQRAQATTRSIPSSPGSSSLPSPPSSPQLAAQGLHASHNAATAQGLQGLQAALGDSLPGSPLSIASSFPSGASSFIFSHSASSSPPYIGTGSGSGHHHNTGQSDVELDPLGLVIPSLTLPPAISSDPSHAGSRHSDSAATGLGAEAAKPRTGKRHRRNDQPSPFGESLGNLDLYIFGRKGAGKTAVANMLVDGNDDVVSVLGWDTNVLTASTAWKDARMRKGSRNVRIVEIEGFDEDDDQASEVLQPLLHSIHDRFEKVASGLSEQIPTSREITQMLASGSTPLPTALIFLLSSPPTPLELTLLSLVSTHIPTITLPPYPTSTISTATSFSSLPQMSMQSTVLLDPVSKSDNKFVPASFRPRNTLELRAGLFRSHSTLQSLRNEAVERFEHWREIRRACNEMGMNPFATQQPTASIHKEKRPNNYDAELERRRKLDWELRLSQDVAVAFSQGHIPRETQLKTEPTEDTLVSLTESMKLAESSRKLPLEFDRFENTRHLFGHGEQDPFFDYHNGPDPLHLPTLFRLSTALLGALGKRLVSSFVQRTSNRSGNHRTEKKGDVEPWELESNDENEGDSWTLSKWGIAGIAFMIGYCAGKILVK